MIGIDILSKITGGTMPCDRCPCWEPKEISLDLLSSCTMQTFAPNHPINSLKDEKRFYVYPGYLNTKEKPTGEYQCGKSGMQHGDHLGCYLLLTLLLSTKWRC